MVRSDVQIALLEESLKLLGEKQNDLLKDRDLAEAEYRVQATEADFLENEMKEATAEARESPRKPILLQAIYLTHKKVVASFDTVKDTEQQKETLHEEACVCDTNMASLNAELQQKEDQVPDRVFMHTHSCPQLKLYHVRCPGCQLQNGATSHSFLYSGRDLRDKYFNKKKHRINGEEDGNNARSNTKRYIISCQC